MTNPDPHTSQIIGQLQSGHEPTINEGLKHIRSEGNSHLLPVLINLMLHTPNEHIERECLLILCDLKDSHAPDIICQSIRENRSNQRLPGLISSCWQSMLDYSEHLQLFAELSVEGNYQLALESFSVIEENIQRLGNPERELMAEYIRTNLAQANPDKRKLLVELISVVSPFQGPFRIAGED